MFRKATAFVAAVLAMGAVVAPAHAQSDVSSELAKMRAEIAELRAETGKTYVEGRRADEVKSMIADVLEDSESRNALADGSSTAGYKKGFFLASADGNFKMEIGILVRVRWYANFRDWDDDYNAGNTDDNEISTGFTVYEAEIGFEGHVFDPNILYSVVIEVDEDGDVVVDTAAIGYAGFFDGLEVWAGTGIDVSSTLDQDKSSKRQQAVERSYTTRRLDFSGGSAVGIAASWSNDFISVAASFTNSGSGEWNSGGTSGGSGNNGGYTLGTRVAVKLLGDWKQYKDFASWSGQDVMLVIGGGLAIAYGTNANGAPLGLDTPEGNDDWHAFLWTVDASFEWNGISIWVSGLGVHGVAGDSDNNTGGYLELYGIVGTAAYNIMDTVELFVRGEGIIVPDDEGGDSSSFNNQGLIIVTVGGTWFLYKHNLKVTADIGFVIGEVNVDDEKAGVLETLPLAGNDQDTELQVVARVQVLLYF